MHGIGKRKRNQETNICRNLGGISHNEFWKRKSYAPDGIVCNVKNLRAIAEGTNIDDLPCKVTGYKKQNQILQQKNYIVDSKTQLNKLEDII